MEAKPSRFEADAARRQQSLSMVHAILANPSNAAEILNPPPPAPPPPPPGPSDAERRWAMFMSRQLGPDPCRGERLRSTLEHFRSEGVNVGPDSMWGHLLKG